MDYKPKLVELSSVDGEIIYAPEKELEKLGVNEALKKYSVFCKK